MRVPSLEIVRAREQKILVGLHGSVRTLVVGLISTFLLVSFPPAAAQTTHAIEPGHEHPAPGTKLTRFEEIDNGVYKGSEPRNDADYRFLQSKHIKYIIAMKFLPLLDRFEIHKARKYGILVIPVRVNASTFAPSEKHIRQILCLLSDKRFRPVYFHCTIGRDRTALIATLYEIYFLGVPPEKARDEMKRFGFKGSWTLSGLSNYLEEHAKSEWPDGKHICKPFRLPASNQ
jgi:hypothetical protein